MQFKAGITSADSALARPKAATIDLDLPNPMHSSDDGSRRRTARACDSCYKRKIKCDSLSSQCNWCSHHNLPCTFDRVVPRKQKNEYYGGRPKTSWLSERVNRIEQPLADSLMLEPGSGPMDFSRTSDGSTASNLPSTGTNILPLLSSSVGIHFAGRELGVINSLTNMPFLLPEGREWIHARTGQIISSEKLSPTRAPWEKERKLTSNTILMNLQSHDLFELPDWRSVRIYFEAYKSSPVMQRIFPVVDVKLFEDTITKAYQKPQSCFRLVQASTRLCIIAFLAFISRLPRALYEVPLGNLRATNYLGALAARLIFMLGGNLPNSRTYSEGEHCPRRQQQLRNLFWICYTVDKDFALRTGQPPVISDENCDLTLPTGYLDRAFSDPENEDMPYEHPVFPLDLRLSIIKSRIYSALYSVSALQKSDADLLKSIRKLDDELEQWRLSIPTQWRPTMSFSPEASDPNVSMYAVMLRLNYYLCTSIIHQASSRCKAWLQGNVTMEGVNSSLALSVEASRSTLCYLEAAEHVLGDCAFWVLIYYPMSALLTIFCNILQNPIDPRSQDDLDRLKMATVMMDRDVLREQLGIDNVHFKLVAGFVVELKWLAECAIDKAWREQRAGSLQP
ncbi:hypothetical protein N7490_001868 [Penicillium lividum]|nr:hypothetical protein N7490_001868 [Penicillium lividum]